MRLLIFLLLLLLAATLPAQEPVPNPSEKGAAPLTSSNFKLQTSNSTRAVVVGISDYQHKDIPDLRFAHRDAEAFTDWLKSPAGGSVPEDNIRLLTDARATNAAIAYSLYELLDSCRAGDLVIVYFSGHGDVESRLRNQPGFLLTYDSPPRVYATNALDLRALNDIVATLAEQQVRVILVTDACHAGKLAGSASDGGQSTALALQQQFAHAVKIMSCQPNEFSLEGEQWGGGRGVFSFHLLDGLTGLADNNTDGAVSLLEIGRYLEDRVPAETAPHPQTPITAGERNFRLAGVHAPSLAALRQRKQAAATLAGTGSKGIEDEVLARADSLTRARYRAFGRALQNGALLGDADTCADALFGHLSASEDLRPLHGILRRNFAVALLDEVQQALNALMNDDPYEVNQWRYKPDKYKLYPAYLDRALELLGPDHYMVSSLRVKKLYFEGYFLGKQAADFESKPARKDSLRGQAKAKLLDALRLEPDAAYIHHAIGMLYFGNTPYRSDSVMLYCQRAVELAPTWVLPYVDMAQEQKYFQMRADAAQTILEKCLEASPNSFVALERYAWNFQFMEQSAQAIPFARRLIELRPDLTNGYSTLGNIYLMMNEYENGLPMSKKGMELAPEIKWWAYMDYGQMLNRTRRWVQAEAHLQGPLADTSLPRYDWVRLLDALVYGFLESRQFEKAAPFAQQMFEQEDWVWLKTEAAWYLGFLAFEKGDYPAAKTWMLKTLELDPTPNPFDGPAYSYLGLIEEKMGNLSAARTFFDQRKTPYYLNIEFPLRSISEFQYGGFLLRQKQEQAAFEVFSELTRRYPKEYRGWYGLALYHAWRGEKQTALDCLERSLDCYYPVPQPILEEPLFKKIRKTKRFKAMMAKHFPAE